MSPPFEPPRLVDPFLHTHRIAPGLFSVAGRLHPISIRDQIIRGQLFVQRALREQVIRPDPRAPAFVVVGAGVAGVTAAIEAAEHRVRTILVERAPQAFATQASCQTRWIDPTQYDWPVGHWRVAEYPWDASSLRSTVLPWNDADYAHNLAGTWLRVLKNYTTKPGSLLSLRQPAVVTDVRPSPTKPGREVVADIEQDSRSTTETASAVLIATGFGSECCNLEKTYHRHAPRQHPTYGTPFWSSDKLAHPGFDIARQSARVLISGAGDGSLQDFLRVVVDPSFPSARAILNHLQMDPGVWARIHDAQDHVDRHVNWSTKNEDDHGSLTYLQTAFDTVASAVLGDWVVRRQIDSMLRRPRPDVYLVYNCSHFGRGYALNRFLALLLIRYLEQDRAASGGGGGLPLLNPYRRLVNLDPVAPHGCGPAPACYGHPHAFELAETTGCVDDKPLATDGRRYEGPPQDIRVMANGEADIFVLHHGPRLTDIPENLLPLHYPPFARQMLPYGLIS